VGRGIPHVKGHKGKQLHVQRNEARNKWEMDIFGELKVPDGRGTACIDPAVSQRRASGVEVEGKIRKDGRKDSCKMSERDKKKKKCDY
jgi:hypothetical protein